MRDVYLQKKITQLLNERNWTVYQLAKESNLSYSTLRDILQRGHVPTIPVLMQVCEGFGITMSDFFDEEGQEVKRLDISDQQVIADFHRLPRDNKKLVTAYMKGFIKASTASKAEDNMHM